MNNQTQINFGTDGWRAIIADGFTFNNVRTVAQAWASYLKANETENKGTAVSYDTRFLSKEFAEAIAKVLAGNHINVYLSDRPTPTPALSSFIAHNHLAGGIMVTASHNPYYYNGIKFKDAYGGPVLPVVTSEIKRYLSDSKTITKQDEKLRFLSYENILDPYLDILKGYINFDLLNRTLLNLAWDPMYGAGIGILDFLLKDTGFNIRAIHNIQNPSFDGRHPEPIPSNLMELSNLVTAQNLDLGMATDGDADRFGIIGDDGAFVQLHDLMPLLFKYLVESRDWNGDVVRTSSMANTIDKMANKYNRKVLEVPVGFKNITEMFLKNDILIGGEESGGFGYKNHIPERDGIISNLLVLEMLADYKISVSELVRELRQEFGPFAYGRIDEYFDSNILLHNLESLKEETPLEIAGLRINEANTSDGIKFYFENDTWMLIRVSQTEPLARIYVASTNQKTVNKLLKGGKNLITRQ